MPRLEFNRKTRQAALARSGGKCEASGTRYGFKDGVRCGVSLAYGVEFDHDVPDALSGLNDLDNCRAVCVPCHRHKTSKTDVPQIAKADRVRAKANNTWPKSRARIPSRPFPRTREEQKNG